MAGFDSADHFAGPWMTCDAFDAPRYRRRVEADYQAARDADIECVRESIDWRRAARSDDFDFETVAMRAAIARRFGMQIIWTLCHSSWPEDVGVDSAAFVERFRRFATAAARTIGEYTDDAPVYTPVNEISFLGWALAETSLFRPQRSERKNQGYVLKRHLVRAALAACDAILEVDPRARFLHTEPVMNVAGRFGQPALHDDAVATDVQFHAWDMLAGRLEPRLGGHPRYLDLVGVHYHHGSHGWRGTPVAERPVEAPLGELHRLLADVHARYARPIVVGETSNAGAGRAAWLRRLGGELCEALEQGIPLLGASLCRVVERPAWEDPRYWRGRRLWDALLDTGDASPVASSAYSPALRDVQARVGPLLPGAHHRHSS